ncbi:MAG TPA: hypothetical protein DEP57_06220 [Selenomonas sp.]|nr:TonB family protein [Selenomonadaceae bacterium]HCB93389.1 hypothetical protein [Selenomonas sp.]
MRSYSSRWTATFIAAIVLHLIFLMAFACVLPNLMPKQELKLFQEMEWVEADLPEEAVPEEAVIMEPLPNEPASEPMIYEEEVIAAEVPEESEEIPIVEEAPDEAVEKLMEEMEKADSEGKSPEIAVPPANTNQRMGQPPVVLKEVYPPAGGLRFDGSVTVAATIGRDGRVKRTKVIIGSGRLAVDNIAISAVAKWIFKPALDEDGKPMECDKIIIIDFTKLTAINNN